MYSLNQFGLHVFECSVGKAWMDLVGAVLKEGRECFDEGRKRLALDNVRVKIANPSSSDSVISEFGNKDNLKTMLDLTFKEPVMYDCDVNPSFSPGAKSYFQRIQDGQLFDYVVKRLKSFPESKKAVMVFPTCDDYRQVLNNMHDDYLPCLVSLQFRLVECKSFALNASYNFRSMDVYQKGHGNFVALAKMTELLAERIGQNLGVKVCPGFLDGIIVDAHIYADTFDEAKIVLEKYKKGVR